MVGEVGLFGLIQCTAFIRAGGHSSAGVGAGLFLCVLDTSITHFHWIVGAAPSLIWWVALRSAVLQIVFFAVFCLMVLLIPTGISAQKKKAPIIGRFPVVHYSIISMSIDAIGYGTAFVILVSIANRVPLS